MGIIETGPRSVSITGNVSIVLLYSVKPPIKDTPNKEHLSIKDKSTRPSSYYTSTF